MTAEPEWVIPLETLSEEELPTTDPFDDVDDSLDVEFRRERMRKALAHLPPRDRQILELRFGVRDVPWTLSDIGEQLGLTRERVKQLESIALARLAGLSYVA